MCYYYFVLAFKKGLIISYHDEVPRGLGVIILYAHIVYKDFVHTVECLLFCSILSGVNDEDSGSADVVNISPTLHFPLFLSPSPSRYSGSG